MFVESFTESFRGDEVRGPKGEYPVVAPVDEFDVFDADPSVFEEVVEASGEYFVDRFAIDRDGSAFSEHREVFQVVGLVVADSGVSPDDLFLL